MDTNIIDYAKAAALIGAAISIGIGVVGPSIAQGLIGAKACESVGKYPDSYSKVKMLMIISMGLVETCALYSFIIAMLLIYKS